MSTAPAPAIKFEITCTCATCSKELHSSLSSTEQQFKENAARAVTASELHDCRKEPKS